MNEEAINHSYELFKSDGYNGTLDDYKALLVSDEEAVNYSYELFSKDGYQDSFENFRGLVLPSTTPEAPKGVEAETSTESNSPSASGVIYLSDSELGVEPEKKEFTFGEGKLTFPILPPEGDYQHMQGYVDNLRRKMFRGQMEQDADFQKELKAIQATGNQQDVDDLKSQYLERAYWSSRPSADRNESQRSIDSAKEMGWEVLETRDEGIVKNKYNNLAERKDFKYKDDQGVISGTKEVDGIQVTTDSSTLDSIYGDLSKYNLDKEDFNTFIETGNDRVKRLFRAGYFTTDTTDVLLDETEEKSVREASKNRVLSAYVNDRIIHLKGKHLGLVKKGKIEEAKKVEKEIKNTARGYQEYIKNELPNYKAARDQKLEDEYKEYLEEENIGGVKKTWRTTVKSVDQFGEGIMGASGDISTYLLDLVGADDSAEYQRMINDYNNEFEQNSLVYGVASGNRVVHNGKNYLTTKTGRIIDLDAGMDITAIAGKLGLDTDAILEKGRQSTEEDTSYSTSGLIIKSSEVLGNLAFQVAATRGTGGTLGVTSRSGMIVNSMAVQSGIVSASTYEETLSALRDANIDDETSKGEALELSLKMGAVTALTSILSPNSSAVGIGHKGLDKRIAKNLADAYVTGGREGFKKMLWQQVKERGINLTREGFEESVQEMTELVSQKMMNAKINDNLGRDVLDTSITKDEILETFILSTSTAGLMASTGKTSRGYKDRLSMLEYFSQDVGKAEEFINTYQEEGAINEATAEKIKKDIRNYAAYSNKIPSNVELTKVEPLLEMLDERNQLEQAKKNQDKAFHPFLNKELKEVDGRIANLLSKPTQDAKEETTTETVPTRDTAQTETQTTQGQDSTAQTETETEVGIEDEISQPIDPSVEPTTRTEKPTEVQQEQTTTDEQITPETQQETQQELPEPIIEEVTDRRNVTDDARLETGGEQDFTIKETLAASRDYFSESDRKVAERDLKQKIDSMVRQGNLTQAQARNLLKKATTVDPTNQTQVDNFVSELDKQMNKAKTRDAKKQLRSLKRKVKKAGRAKSKRTPQSVKDLAVAAGKINEKYLTESQQQSYRVQLEELDRALKPVTSKDYKPVVLSDTERELTRLHEKAEKQREEELRAELGDAYDDIKLWESSEEFEDQVATLRKERRDKLKEDLSNIAEGRKGSLNKVKLDDLSTRERKTLKTFKNAVMSDLSTSQIRDFIKITDNIFLNQDFSNAGVIEQALESAKDVKSILAYNSKNKVNPRELNTGREALKIFGLQLPNSLNVPDHIKHLINAMTSLNITLDIIGGNSKNGAFLYNKLGFFELSNRKTKAEARKSKFDKEYNDMIDKLAKKNKKLLNGDQSVRRAALATLLQAYQNSEESMRFFKKSYLQGSIDTLSQYKNNHQQSNEKKAILESVLQETEGIKTKEELIDYLKAKDPDNFKILKFASDYFLKHSKEFENNAYMIHGETFDARTQEDFYLPLMRSSLINKSMVKKINDARESMNFMSFRPSTPKSGSIFTRKKNARLERGQTINFNFDAAIVQKYGEQIYDIESSGQIIKIKSILSSPQFIEEFGLGTAQTLQKKAIDKIAMDSGAVFTSQYEWEKNFGKIEQTLRKLGSINALGGVDQFLKQYPAVVLSAGIRLKADAPLLGKYMFTSKKDIGLLKASSIRLRAEADAGIKRATDIKLKDLSLGEKTKVQIMAKMLSKYGGITLEKARYLSMLSLRVGDVQAANTTFLAYYHSFLRKKGVPDSEIDMDTEHVKIEEGDKLRKEAQAYAQHMVNTTQTSSDLTEGSQFVASPNVMTRFFMGAIMPFSSHANNAMIRMLKAASNFARGRNQVDNAVEIAASISEITTFHAMKAFLIAPVAIWLGHLLFGGSDDEDKPLVDWGFQTVKAASGVLGDISPLPDSFDIDAANYLIYLYNRDEFGEDLTFKEYNQLVKKIKRGKSKYFSPEDAPTQFYRYGDKDGFETIAFDDFGLYNIPKEQAQKTWQAIDFLYDGKLEKQNRFGKTEQYELADENLDFMYMYTLTEFLATFAVGDATTRRMMERRYREIEKDSKVKKKRRK
jgi:hypothetical protein